jgi:hypothetical protein
VVPAVPVGECEHSDPDGLLAGHDRRSSIRSTAVLTSVSLGGCSGVPLLNMPAQSKSWLQRSAVRATPPTLAAAYLWVVRSRYLVVRGAWVDLDCLNPSVLRHLAAVPATPLPIDFPTGFLRTSPRGKQGRYAAHSQSHSPAVVSYQIDLNRTSHAPDRTTGASRRQVDRIGSQQLLAVS